MSLRQREPRLKSKRITDDARDMPCQSCGVNDGTVINAHCNDMEFRGMGMKCDDALSAWCCGTCHSLIDGQSGNLTLDEKRQMWDRAFKRTVRMRFRLGLWRVA